MKNTFKKSLQTLLIVPILALGVSFAAGLVSSPVASAACTGDVTDGIGAGADCAKGKDQQTELFGPGGAFTTVTNVMLYVIGAVSVIMLIIGGIRYVLSSGDSAAVTSAKNTILYAIVGVIVAILAYAIVNFVVVNFAAGQ